MPSDAGMQNNRFNKDADEKIACTGQKAFVRKKVIKNDFNPNKCADIACASSRCKEKEETSIKCRINEETLKNNKNVNSYAFFT